MNIKTDYSRRAGAEQTPTDQPINLPPGDIGPTDSDSGYSEALVRRILIADRERHIPAPVASHAGSEPDAVELCKWCCGTGRFSDHECRFCSTHWVFAIPTPVEPTEVAPTDRAAQSKAQSPALLFAHDDGRHAVAHAGAAFLADPAWHRVGPVEVHGAQSPQGAPIAYLHPITHPNWLDVCEPGSPGAFPVFAAPQGGEAAQASAPLCMCKDRAASGCPGEWEPGCDLGNNEAHVRVSPRTAPQPLEFAQADAPGRSEHAVEVDEYPVGYNINNNDSPFPRYPTTHAAYNMTWKNPAPDASAPRVPNATTHKVSISSADGYRPPTPQPLLHGAPESARQPLTQLECDAAWIKACREIIDRCVAPDMYANAMNMLAKAAAMKAAGARE